MRTEYLKGAEPLFIKGTRTGCLLLHGAGGGTAWDLKEFADALHMKTPLELSESSKDPAMAKTVEELSAALRTGALSIHMQRTEVTSRPRSYISVKLDKAHVTVSGSGLIQAGDSSREKDGTQKFLAVRSLTECKKQVIEKRVTDGAIMIWWREGVSHCRKMLRNGLVVWGRSSSGVSTWKLATLFSTLVAG